jgi:Tfp pilus assembly protein PilF
MCFDWQKIIKRFLIVGCWLCFGLHFSLAQTARQPAKQQNSISQMLSQATNLLTDARTREDYAQIKTILLKVLTAAPKNVAAHTLAGFVADRENDLKTAEKHFATAIRLQPESPETHNNYGAILTRLKRENEAAKEFEISLKLNPNQPSAQANLAQIHFERGKPADLQTARRLFEKVFQSAPDVEIARSLVIIALRLNEIERAAQDFKRYAQLAENITLPNASRIELASALLERGLNAEAVHELEKAVALDSSNVVAIILLSRAYLKQKNIKSAGRTLESALSRGVNDARLYAVLTDVYEAGGYYENAVPAMKIAIERDPRNEHYRFRYGMLLIETKAPPAAVIRLKEAVQEFPRSARLWLGLGIAQYYDSKLNDAEQSINRALELNPKLVLAFTYLAFIRNVNGQSEAANSYLKRALALEENNAVIHYLLADNLQKIATSDVALIEKHLRRAIQLDSELSGAYLALGRSYARQKKFTEAAPLLEKTIKLEPNRTEAYYQLAQVYARLKRPDESRAMLAKFKELSESDKNKTKTEYAELLRRLANVQF